MSQHTRAAISTLVLFGVGALAYRNVTYSKQLRFLASQKAEDPSREFPELRKPGQRSADALRQLLPASALALALPLTALWTLRASRAVHRLLLARYADPTYQLTRPDALKNKIFAWKFLGLGLFALPVSAGLGTAWRRSEISRTFQGAAEISDGTLRDFGKNFRGSMEADHVRAGVRDFLKSIRSDLVLFCCVLYFYTLFTYFYMVYKGVCDVYVCCNEGVM